MFTYEDYDGTHVTVKATHQRYHTRFLASDEAEASKIVADLNRPLLLQELADYRFTIETGGLHVGDQDISTDRESQAQLTGAFASLQNEFVTQTRWKSRNGWQTVDLQTIAPLAKAVAQHVDQCFQAEGRVADELNTIVDHSTMAEYDVREAFITQLETSGDDNSDGSPSTPE